MSGPGSVILICVSMVLVVGALVFAWDGSRQARRAEAAQRRAEAAYAKIQRLREGR